jgi:hypothetical protein
MSSEMEAISIAEGDEEKEDAMSISSSALAMDPPNCFFGFLFFAL